MLKFGRPPALTFADPEPVRNTKFRPNQSPDRQLRRTKFRKALAPDFEPLRCDPPDRPPIGMPRADSQPTSARHHSPMRAVPSRFPRQANEDHASNDTSGRHPARSTDIDNMIVDPMMTDPWTTPAMGDRQGEQQRMQDQQPKVRPRDTTPADGVQTNRRRQDARPQRDDERAIDLRRARIEATSAKQARTTTADVGQVVDLRCVLYCAKRRGKALQWAGRP